MDYLRERTLPTSFTQCGSDSNNAETPHLQAFETANWDYIVKHFEALYFSYTEATKYSYDNADGKTFCKRLLQFCCLVDEGNERVENYSTGSSGELQPGCTTKRNSRSRSTSQDRSSSAIAQGAEELMSPPAKRQKTRATNLTIVYTYSDFSMWDPVKEIYIISGEIKSTPVSVFDQCVDQMFGLLRAHQNVILGLCINPSYIEICVLETISTPGKAILHVYEHLVTTYGDTFPKLCEILISYIFLVEHS